MSRRGRSCVLVLITALALAGIAIAASGCGKKGSSSSSASSAAASPAATAASSSPVVTPTPVATVAPAGGAKQVIAVASGPHGNALSAVTPTGSFKMLVAPKAGPIRDISWSPDATCIAYVQPKSSNEFDAGLRIYKVSTGTVTKPLVDGAVPYAVVGYTWVAPSQLIASVFKTKSVTYHANGKLYLIDVAAGTAKPVDDDSGTPVLGIQPSASADSMGFSFVRYGAPAAGMIGEDLMLYDANTLGVSKIAHGSAPTDVDGDHFSFPLVSPGGTMVATSSTGSDVGYSFTVYRVDGTKAFGRIDLTWPTRMAWNPVSTGKLAYGAGDSTTSFDAVWVQSTSGKTKVVSLPGKVIGDLAWSPDGTKIAYTVFSATGPGGNLYTVKAFVGATPHLLLKNADWPAWAVAKVPGL
jgi:WD40 repeat protein